MFLQIKRTFRLFVQLKLYLETTDSPVDLQSGHFWLGTAASALGTHFWCEKSFVRHLLSPGPTKH